jgi:hypothetical protein
MSTPSMVLLGAGTAASLAGVWALAGLSERSGMRSTPRVVVATAIGVLGLAALYGRAPAELRSSLSLPALFGAVAVLSVGAGAAKLDAALADRDGARAVRRAAGLVGGSFLGMASVAAVSFELLLSSLLQARFGWACMLPVVVSSLIVFAQRGRLAGAGAISLGKRGLVLGLLGLALVVGLRFWVTPASAAPRPRATPVEPAAAPAAEAQVPEATVPAAAPTPETSAAAAVASAAPSAPGSAVAALAPSAAPGSAPGQLQVETVTTRGILEADARGGVERRIARLQACLAEPTNQQSGVLSLKIGIDSAGSVSYSKATGGDLVGTPLAACLLSVFYKMGFAAPASSSAHFQITLRVQPRGL